MGLLRGDIEVESVLRVLHKYEVNLVQRLGSLFAVIALLGPVCF